MKLHIWSQQKSKTSASFMFNVNIHTSTFVAGKECPDPHRVPSRQPACEAQTNWMHWTTNFYGLWKIVAKDWYHQTIASQYLKLQCSWVMIIKTNVELEWLVKHKSWGFNGATKMPCPSKQLVAPHHGRWHLLFLD